MDADVTVSVPTDVYDAFPPTWSEVPAVEDPSFIGNQNDSLDTVVTTGDPFPIFMAVDTFDNVIIPAADLEGQQDMYDNPGVPTATTTISSVVPSTFAYEGTTFVTVTGTNLSSVVTARISSTLVNNLVVVNASTITFTAPTCPSIATTGGPMSLGLYDLYDILLSSVGVSYAPSATPFALTTTTLNTCPVTGNLVGQLVGTGFFFITRMFVCGVEVQQFTVLSDTLIEYTLAPYSVPVGTTNGDVVLENGDGSLRTLTGAFSYTIPLPWANGADVTELSTTGGTQIRVQGNYFMTLTSVLVNGTAVSFLVESDTSVVLTGPVGVYTGLPVDVVFTNATGSYTWTGALRFAAPAGAPTISYVVPTTLVVGVGGTLEIVGTNLAGITSAWVDGAPAVITSSSLGSCVLACPAGVYTGSFVDVTISDGSTIVTQPQAVMYVYGPPTITATTVSSGPKSGGTSGTVYGTNFVLVSSFAVGSVPVASYTVVSPTQIDFVTGASPNFGVPSDIRVQCLFGEGILAHAFAYTEGVRIDATSLSSDTVLGGTVGVLTGAGFTTTTSVSVGGAITTFTVLSDASVSFVVPANVFTDTLVDIVLTTSAAGTATFARAFLYVPVLSVGSLDVTTGDRTGGDVVNVSGAGFYEVQSVLLGGVSASFEFVSLTQLRFTTPGGVPAGTYDLVVQTRYSSVTLSGAFVYTDWTPQVISLSQALYTMSVQHWGGITTLDANVSLFGATTVPLVSRVQDLSSRVASLVSTVNILSPVFGGAQFASTVSYMSSQVAGLSSTWSVVSTDHWSAISSLSDTLALSSVVPTASSVVASVSDVSYVHGTMSQVQYAAILSMSAQHAVASAQHWGVLSGLSNGLSRMSVEHFAAIQTILPSTAGQSGRFLQYTGTAVAWTSVSVASVSGPVVPVLSSVLVTSNAYVTSSNDTFVLVDDTSLSTGFYGSNIAVSIQLATSGLSDGALVVVKRVTSDASKYTKVRVPISNGGSTTEYILSGPYTWIAARYTNVLSGYAVLDTVLGTSEPYYGTLSFSVAGVSAVDLGGAVVNLTGVSSAMTRAVYVDGVSVVFSGLGPTQVQFAVPVRAAGAYANITVENLWGLSVTRVSAIKYNFVNNWGSGAPGLSGLTVLAAADGIAYGTARGRAVYSVDTTAITWLPNNLGNAFQNWTVTPVGDVCCERSEGKVLLVPINGGPYYYSTDRGQTYVSSALSNTWTGFTTSPNGSYVLGATMSTIYTGTSVASVPVTFTSGVITGPTFSYVSTNQVVSLESSTLALASGAVVSTWGAYTLSGPGTATYSAGGTGSYGTKPFVEVAGSCFVGPSTTLNMSSNGGLTVAALFWVPTSFPVPNREYPVWTAGKSATNLFDTVQLTVGDFSGVGIGVRVRITNGGASGTDGTDVVYLTSSDTDDVRPGAWNVVVMTTGAAVGSMAKLYLNGVDASLSPGSLTTLTAALTDRVASNVYMNFFNGTYNPTMKYGSVWVWDRRMEPTEADDVRMVLETFRVVSFGVSDEGNALAVVGSFAYRSVDAGLNWVSLAALSGYRVSGVAVANGGKMYACTRGGRIFRSADAGATWTRVANVSGGFRGIATSSNGRYIIATTAHDAVFVSSDFGATFEVRVSSFPGGSKFTVRSTPSPGSQAWQNAAWSPKLEVMVACGSADALVSYNAVDFRTVSLPVANNYTDVCWSEPLGQFVMVSGGAGVLTSPDGLVWTYTSAVLNLSRIRWIDELSVYVAISPDGSIYTSVDGTTYIQQFVDVSRAWYGLAWSGTVLVATSLDGWVYSSADGVVWTARFQSAGQMFVSAAWSDALKKFVVVSQSTGTQYFVTSPDGVAWTQTLASATSSNQLKDIVWVPEYNKFYAAGQSTSASPNPPVLFTFDGQNWNAVGTFPTPVPNNAWYGLCWCPKFSSVVAVSTTGTGNRVVSSVPDDNGVWSNVCMGPSASLVIASGSTVTKRSSA